MTKRKLEQWVIPPEQDAEFVACMEEVLETYAAAYDPKHPVLCMDEQPVQLLKETRVPIAATKEHGQRVDYEYERKGTASIFMFAEPLSGFRQATARERRTKVDWALEVAQMLDTRSADCEEVSLVCDNLNTHPKGAFYEAFEPEIARAYLKRIKFCYTPKHGSWLNVAECELSCLTSQCLRDRRIGELLELQKGSRWCLVPAWQLQGACSSRPRSGLRATHPTETMTLRFYTPQHRFYGGIDLHARTMALPILDQAGHTVLATTLDADGPSFLDALKPYRDDLVVCCACLFCWYGLADLCKEHDSAFVLGHALSLKAISGGKAKNDTLDAAKRARLLRASAIPYAYVYPQGMRATRDLLRRRLYLVRTRAETITHVQHTNRQYNLPPFGKKLGFAANRQQLNIAERFADPQRRKNIETALHLLDHYDALIADLELHRTRTAKVEDPPAQARLQSIPGSGKILALVLLYELHQIQRFASTGQFLSYCRLVRCSHESAGKKLGFGGATIGTAHVRWAVAAAAVWFARHSPRAKQWLARQAKKLGQGRALSRLAARLGRTVQHLLRKGAVFDENRFWGNRERVAPAAR